MSSPSGRCSPMPDATSRPVVEAWGVRWAEDGRGAGELSAYGYRDEAQWEIDHVEDKYVSADLVPLIAADRLEDEAVWQVVYETVCDERDKYPRLSNDADSGELADAVLAALRAHLESQ